MIEIGIETSNLFTFVDSPTRLFFIMNIQGRVDEVSKKSAISGNWLIIIIDQSSSMVGEKIETAKEAAISTIKELKSGNYISIYAFSDEVEVIADHEGLSDIKKLENGIKEIYAHGR
ncbi:MAG: VWA domain-containing protein, partial [Minisyncoccia bacterium]